MVFTLSNLYYNIQFNNAISRFKYPGKVIQTSKEKMSRTLQPYDTASEITIYRHRKEKRGMKKTKSILIIILIVLCGCAIGLFMLRNTDKEYQQETASINTTKKRVVIGYFTWRTYSLEEATETAATIVYGKVVDKSDMLLRKVPLSDGTFWDDYYTEVYVEVSEVIKGDVTGSTFTYREQGGETEDTIYVMDSVDPVVVGQEYVFFVNQYGAMLSPVTVLPVTDGVISITGGYLVPVNANVDKTVNEMDVADYISAIKEKLE